MGIMAKLFSAHWHPHPNPLDVRPAFFQKASCPQCLLSRNGIGPSLASTWLGFVCADGRGLSKRDASIAVYMQRPPPCVRPHFCPCSWGWWLLGHGTQSCRPDRSTVCTTPSSYLLPEVLRAVFVPTTGGSRWRQG